MSRLAIALSLMAATATLVAGCKLKEQAEPARVGFDLSPDGGTLVFSAADGDLYLLSLADRRVRRVTDTPVREETPAFAPDGAGIIYAAAPPGEGGSLYARSLHADDPTRLTHEAEVSDFAPSYSPSGAEVVFARGHHVREKSTRRWMWSDWDLWIARSDGSDPRQLTHEWYPSVSAPRFSREGRSVLYSAPVPQPNIRETAFEVSLGPGDAPHRLMDVPRVGTDHGAWAFGPEPSPDGKSVVFVSDRAVPYHYDLIVTDREGGRPNALGVTAVSQYSQNPRFAPDGGSVLFLGRGEWNAGAGPNFHLWRVDVEGKQIQELADPSLFVGPLAWRPKPMVEPSPGRRL